MSGLDSQAHKSYRLVPPFERTLSATPQLTAERETLLLGARVAPTAEEMTRLAHLIGQGVDWPVLKPLAVANGVAPLLHRNILTAAGSALPGEMATELRRDAHGNAFRNLFLVGELRQLLEALTRENIRAIPLKGPVVAHELYGDVSLRTMGDLDVLVHPDDTLRATEVLMSSGYLPTVQLEGRWQREYLRHQHHYKCVRSDGEVREIHWSISTRAFSFDLSFDELWGRRRVLTLAGAEMPTLSAEDLFLTLTMHGTTHAWSRLSWICDLAELVRVHETIDWEVTEERARNLGVLRAGRVALLLASGLLRARLPEPLSAVIWNDERAVKLSTEVYGRLFPPSPHFSDTLGGAFFHLRIRERLRDRLAYLAYNDSVTPHFCDRDFLALPDWCYPLYYGVKPIRLLVQRILRKPPTAR